jgi:hypothetical protein
MSLFTRARPTSFLFPGRPPCLSPPSLSHRSGPGPTPAPCGVLTAGRPPFLCFLRAVQKGRRLMPPRPFRPLLPSSLAAHPEPTHPSPSIAHPRQRPCLGCSSLLAGPPLPPPRPRGELRLLGFSAQFPLCSSPPLHVRCWRSSPTSPPTTSPVRTPPRVTAPS